jgi:leucyl aminopeptidase
MHAVGRASDNEPAMVSLEWRGNPESDEYVSLVGKGVCFDAGGLNLKPTTSIGGMHNDKHGACSVLSAIKSVAHLGLKVNVVATIGLVENFISANSYRPLDIIQSRKGLTVEIGNTDAEGRLVLADCMNWVQENYLGKVKTMIDMATLTGACVIALGKNRAGVFTNSDHLAKQLDESGTEIEELVWRLPLDEYHDELIKSKQADITNASRRPEASSSQAAAFLQKFVEKGVSWAHIDIAGTADSGSYSTGYGAKLLLHYLFRISPQRASKTQ